MTWDYSMRNEKRACEIDLPKEVRNAIIKSGIFFSKFKQFDHIIYVIFSEIIICLEILKINYLAQTEPFLAPNLIFEEELSP